MQDNIGYLVTCAHSQVSGPGRKYGSVWPRCCDVPAFVTLLLWMPAANAATFVAFWVMPLAVWVNLNHGHSMRAKLCSKGSSYEWAPSVAIVCAGVATFIYGMLRLATRAAA